MLNDARTYKTNEVVIKVRENYETRELAYLPAQVKQEIVKEIKLALKGLHIQKQNGGRVGRLKFKSARSTIPLKQPGNTFKFLNSQKTRVRIQKLGVFQVLGGRRIPEGAEVAKAYLQKRADGYHLLVVCYVSPAQEKTLCKHQEEFNKAIGVDLGVKDQVVFSNGLRLAWQVEETAKLKCAQTLYNHIKSGQVKVRRPKRKLQRLKEVIEREHLRIRYRRLDIRNKVISYLKRFEVVAFQEDSIKAWHEGWFGGAVQRSAIGGITARLKGLKESPATPKVEVVPRFVKTTSICANCNTVLEVKLTDRVIACPVCGWTCDRDWNATLVMLKATVGLGRPEGGLKQKAFLPMPGEGEVLVRLFRDNPYVQLSQTLPRESLTL